MKTLLQQNYFQFEGNTYKPIKGIAMGSPISSTSSELILQYHENTTIKHWLETNEIKYYRGYVDDILIIYDSTQINPCKITHFLTTVTMT
jgi:hypothetical protein